MIGRFKFPSPHVSMAFGPKTISWCLPPRQLRRDALQSALPRLGKELTLLESPVSISVLTKFRYFDVIALPFNLP
jgi:hypothetical protein